MRGIQTLPENVEQVGFYNRQPVYRETIRKPIKEVVRVDGKVQYHTNEKGDPVTSRPHTRIVDWEIVTREYQEVELTDTKGRPTGTIQKNYNFREDPEITAEREATKAAESDIKEAAVLARKHGTSITELFNRMLGKSENEEKPEPPKRVRSR